MYVLVRSLTKFYYQDTPILLFLSGTCISTHELDYFRYETPSKVSFSVVNKLLHRTSEAQLPAYDNLSELTNRFANFFVDKISNIRSTLDSSPSASAESLPPVVS